MGAPGNDPVQAAESAPANEHDADEYEVERVIAHRFNLAKKSYRYFLHWKGYPDSERTWEDGEGLHCDALIQEYWERYLAAGGNRMDPQGMETRPRQNFPPAGGGGAKSISNATHVPDAELVKALDFAAGAKQRNASLDADGGTSRKRFGQEMDSSLSAPSKKLRTENGATTIQTEDKQTTTVVGTELTPAFDGQGTKWTPPASLEAWEPEIQRVECVEKVGGKLYGHLRWKNGSQTPYRIEILHRKCPLKLIEFYERRLTFKG